MVINVYLVCVNSANPVRIIAKDVQDLRNYFDIKDGDNLQYSLLIEDVWNITTGALRFYTIKESLLSATEDEIIGRNKMKQRFLDYYMDVAKRSAQMSYATRLKVGACAVKDKRIISTSWNGTPSGADNVCEEMDTAGNLKTKSNVLHAEEHMLLKMLEHGQPASGAILFVTHAPCINCARLVQGCGIIKVYYGEDYRSSEGLDYLRDNGVEVVKYKKENLFDRWCEFAKKLPREFVPKDRPQLMEDKSISEFVHDLDVNTLYPEVYDFSKIITEYDDPTFPVSEYGSNITGMPWPPQPAEDCATKTYIEETLPHQVGDPSKKERKLTEKELAKQKKNAEFSELVRVTAALPPGNSYVQKELSEEQKKREADFYNLNATITSTIESHAGTTAVLNQDFVDKVSAIVGLGPTQVSLIDNTTPIFKNFDKFRKYFDAELDHDIWYDYQKLKYPKKTAEEIVLEYMDMLTKHKMGGDVYSDDYLGFINYVGQHIYTNGNQFSSITNRYTDTLNLTPLKDNHYRCRFNIFSSNIELIIEVVDMNESNEKVVNVVYSVENPKIGSFQGDSVEIVSGVIPLSIINASMIITRNRAIVHLINEGVIHG